MKIEKEKVNKEIEELKPKIIGILKNNRIRKARIFGSYARGEQKKNSDIDILVEFDKEISLFDFVGVKLEIEEAIGKTVDLVEYKAVKLRIKRNILMDEVKII
ncbi:nucleotidyltransferase family protein [Candidatus Pacearchaeota archaeon]|nr:nucleotidyltransferase family protein [Candidatus Pacearchaeota archaeon]